MASRQLSGSNVYVQYRLPLCSYYIIGNTFQVPYRLPLDNYQGSSNNVYVYTV